MNIFRQRLREIFFNQILVKKKKNKTLEFIKQKDDQKQKWSKE